MNPGQSSANQAKQQRQKIKKEQTSDSSVRLRPGLPRLTRPKNRQSPVEWQHFGNRIAPTSLNGGDNSALHITNHFHNKYSQSAPRIGIGIPLKGRRTTQIQEKTEETTQGESGAQERMSSTARKSQEPDRGPVQRWFADDDHQIRSTPFGESRFDSMNQGTSEGGVVPSTGGPDQPRRVVLWQNSLGRPHEAFAPMREIIPITDRRVPKALPSGSPAPGALPPGSGQGYLF